MTLTPEQMQAGCKLRDAIQAAHKRHPDCKAVAAMHARADELREALKPQMTDDQYQTLGGGTPKTPPQLEN